MQLGPQVWERRFVVAHDARVVHAYERYFVVQTERFTPDTHGLEDQERGWFKGFRWWRVDELLRSSEPTSPDTLPSLLAQVAAKLIR